MLHLKSFLLAGALIVPGAASAVVASAPQPQALTPRTQLTSLPVQTAAADVVPVDDAHPDAGKDIVVTAPFARDRLGLLNGVSVLAGADLAVQVRGTIGETLTSQAGVSATSFGPNASRPVLRGFQGERIRVLTDGIGSFDVSNTSVDHAVVVNPLLAERIEVLHGPASLLYGSSAIGGVVNIIDTRIPRHVPNEPVHVEAESGYGTAAQDLTGSVSADVPLTPELVAHVDGSYLKSHDLKIGGFVLSDAERENAIANGLPVLANLRGSLPNSSATTWNVAGGLAYVGAGGSGGFAISHYDSNYGVPIRYDTSDPLAVNDVVRIVMQQTRFDARAEVDADGFFERIKLRYGYANYRHSEQDPQGKIGTTFLNKGMEGRIELAQRAIGSWKGAIGAQLITRDFDAIGDEAFLPRNSTVQLGAFVLQEVTVGNVKVEGAARIENSAISSAVTGYNRSFTPVSGSLGASIPLADSGWRLGLDLAHTERGPSSEELLANGPHGGTQAYEIGDPGLRVESSNGAELVLRGKGEGYSLEASAFYDQFKNYIYEVQTGQIIDGLPVFQGRQADASYWGFEIQGDAALARWDDWQLKANALADYVHAELKNIGPVPRIPPLRVRGGLSLVSDRLTGTIDAEYGASQKRTAPNETVTPDYTLVNASLTWSPWAERPGTYVVVSLNNIFDADVRRAASFLKDFAPLPGRDLRVSLHVAI